MVEKCKALKQRRQVRSQAAQQQTKYVKYEAKLKCISMCECICASGVYMQVVAFVVEIA